MKNVNDFDRAFAIAASTPMPCPECESQNLYMATDYPSWDSHVVCTECGHKGPKITCENGNQKHAQHRACVSWNFAGIEKKKADSRKLGAKK